MDYKGKWYLNLEWKMVSKNRKMISKNRENDVLNNFFRNINNSQQTLFLDLSLEVGIYFF